MATKINKAIKISQKHLLGIQDLSINDVNLILEEAKSFIKLNQSKNKRLNVLSGKTQINLFFEPSTRTQSSFELAGKRLGADVMSMNMANSAVMTAEFAMFIDITSAPNLFPANSNELCVLVEGSKNKLIWVLPLKTFNLLFLLWFNLMKLLASSKIKLTSLIDRSWIPRRCFWEILIALFILVAIKINSITINYHYGKY